MATTNGHHSSCVATYLCLRGKLVGMTKRRIIVAITGAAGSIYGVRLLEELRGHADIETHLVVSRAGLLNVATELSMQRSTLEGLADVVHDNRDIGATIEVEDPNGTRRTVRESFLRRATDIPLIYSDEDGERVLRLVSRTLKEEIMACTGKPSAHRMTWYVHSPIDQGSFVLTIRESEKGSEQLSKRLVEEWRHRFARFIPAQGNSRGDPRKKVMRASTALVECLGRPPLDEHYEDLAESAMFA